MKRRLVLRWQDKLDQICGLFEEGEPVPDSIPVQGNLFRLFSCSERYAHFEFQGPLPLPASWAPFVEQQPVVARPLQE